MEIQDIAYNAIHNLPKNASRKDFAASIESTIDQYLSEAEGDENKTQARKDALEQTPLEMWAAPLQASNLASEGEEGHSFKEDPFRRGLIDGDSSFHEAAKWLCDSQGYNLRELLNASSRDDSPFLRTFYDDIDSYPRPCSLLICGTLTCADLLALSQKGAKLIASSWAMVGTYDPISGYGSYMDVVLEREVEVPVTWGGSVPEIHYSGETQATYGVPLHDVFEQKNLAAFEVRT